MTPAAGAGYTAAPTRPATLSRKVPFCHPSSRAQRGVRVRLSCPGSGRNDLVQDAPISRIDLLTCRNTLMYFNAETQARILNRFHFALSDGGVLFLGKAEMLLSHSTLFTPVDLKRRVFRRAPRDVDSVRAKMPSRSPGRILAPMWPGASIVISIR